MKVISTAALAALITAASATVAWAADCDALKNNSYLSLSTGTFNGAPGTAGASYVTFDAAGKGRGQYVDPTKQVSAAAAPVLIELTSITCTSAGGVNTLSYNNGSAGSATMKVMRGSDAILITTKSGNTDMTGWYLRVKK